MSPVSHARSSLSTAGANPLNWAKTRAVFLELPGVQAAHSAGLVILSQVNGSPRLIFRAFLTEEPKKLPCARGLRRRIAAKVGARTENPYEPAADPDTRGRPRSSGAVAGFELRSRDRGGKADGARSDSAPNDAAARDAAHRNDVCRDRVLLAILARGLLFLGGRLSLQRGIRDRRDDADR